MKFLIAGLGSIGRRHLRNLLALGENDITLYRTHQSTLDDQELKEFPVETDLRKALDQQPDGVIISNPTSLHLDVAIPAALAGCHILIEKPISDNLDRIDELQTAVKRGNSSVLVAYQFRFHPGLRRVKELLLTDTIGRPLAVRSHWGEYLPNWHPWEDYRKGYSARKDLGGGVILTLSHPLDDLRWLFGEVVSLWAFSGHYSDLEIDVEDIAEIGLRFADGLLGSVHINYVQKPPTHYLEVTGSDGSIYWDYYTGNTRVFNTKTNEWKTYQQPASFERNELFRAELNHFIDVIKGKAVPHCSLEDGIRALELAIAAQASQDKARIITWEF